jgi:hypothetical protein|tara:strand:- start:1636 stop:4047 length:2412 start_codon:yes stop_codon:yes gene_type:complete
MISSLVPTAAASGPSDSIIFGISYDWEDFENDVFDMTGVDTNAANDDIEEAADYSGFDLDFDQVLSGSSHLFIESWDDDEIIEIEDSNGISHQVSTRVTELTIRHGLLADSGFTSSWVDDNEAIDIWFSASQEMILILDAKYTEYVDSEMLVYGADLEMSGEISNNADLSMNIQVIAAGEVEAPGIDLGYSLSMGIPSLSSEWRVNYPVDYLQQLNQQMESEDPDWFECDNGEQIPAYYQNDGYEDCYDGSDETMVWDCNVHVDLLSLPNLQKSSFDEAISEVAFPNWCGNEVPNELELDDTSSNLPDPNHLYGWYEDELGLAMARNDTHIWEEVYSQSVCYDSAGDSWNNDLGMCGWQIQDNFSADSTLMYEDCCGWAKYELSGEYLFIAPPTPSIYYYDGPVNGNIDGTFDTLTGYSLSAQVVGISTDELGINLDNFNVELSDNILGQGTFSDDFQDIDGQMASWEWDCPPVSGTEELIIDDSNVLVQCGLAAPISPGMAVMMAQSLEPAFDNGIQDLSSVVQNQLESWISEISGDDGSDDVFICDNGQEIPADWENDGEIDCSDGSDESNGTFTCDDGQEIPADWENDGDEDCSDGSDENDGSMNSDDSDRFKNMFDALSESNLEKTMQAFGEKLEELSEESIPSEPMINLEDSCALLFWTTDDSRVIGFAILNSDENLLGSSIYGVKEHDVELNIIYHDGDDARTAKGDVVGLSELREIAPDSKHDISELYDILGDNLDAKDTDNDGIIDYFDRDDDNDGIPDWEDSELDMGGSLPGLGLFGIISILGFALIFSSRKDY